MQFRIEQSTTWQQRAVQVFCATLLVLTSLIGVSAPAQAETGGYPYASYNGPGSNPAGYYWTDSSGNPISPYNYYYRNCTDFVAWKLGTANNFSASRYMGNGANWGVWAQDPNHKYTVDNTPAVGAIAWWGANTLDNNYNVGSFGHVAWVSSVSGTSVTIEEYNYGGKGTWGTRTITPSSTQQVKFIHFKDIQATPAPQGQLYPQYVGIRQGGTIHVKSGLNDAWVRITDSATDIQVAGNRFAYKDGNRRVWAKEGVSGTWYPMADNVDEYRISPTLVVIRQGGLTSAKAGLTDSWVQITGHTSDLQVADNRIAFRDSSNRLWAKEGISGTWYALADGVEEYKLTPQYVTIRQGGTVHVKSGLNDAWIRITDSATDIQVAGNRFAYRDGSSRLWVKEGVSGTWYPMADWVADYKISPTLVVIRQDNTTSAKAGLTDAWVQITGYTSDLQVAGNRIGFRDGTNRLWMKEGISGTWYPMADGVNEYRAT